MRFMEWLHSKLPAEDLARELLKPKEEQGPTDDQLDEALQRYASFRVPQYFINLRKAMEQKQ